MTILDKIIKEKRKEVEQLKEKTFSIQYDTTKTIAPFTDRIKSINTLGIISEIKRASPSKGAINTKVDPVKQAKEYERLGASAISVLTDKPFFQGSMDDLRMVREAVDIPILRKDFIIDQIQIDEARAFGANMILLIAAALNDEQLKSLYNYALENGLEVLCEVNNEEEMERVLSLNANIIGINNRDLKTFTVDLNTTEKLAKMVTDPNTILISESGIKTEADAIEVEKHGADAILVGETLMKADNLNDTFTSLQVPRSQ